MDKQRPTYTHDKNKKTITFVSECGRFKFTVKDSFIHNAIGELDDQKLLEPVYNLNKFYRFFSYLHNETGPAIEYLETPGVYSFWIDGKELQDKEKMTHNFNFKNKFKSFLEE